MKPLQVSNKRPLASGYEVNYYRVIFTLFGLAYLFSYYYSRPEFTPLQEFLIPRNLFALLPLLLVAATYPVKWARAHIKDLGSGFFLVCSLYLIGFFALNGFHTHYEIGIITLILISNLHLNKVLYIVLYNVIVLTALEFVFMAAAPNANIQPVLFFIFLLLVMLLCIYYQLYRIRYYEREAEMDQLRTGLLSGNPDAWMIFEAPGLIAIDAGSNALTLFNINPTDSLDQVSLRTLIAAGTAIESDTIIKKIISGTVTGLKTQCRKLTGEIFWADISSFRIPGKSDAIYCRFLDISENKWSQEDANENAIRFRRYLDNTTEGLIACDANGTIRMINRAVLNLLEADPSVPRIGKNISEILDPETTQSLMTILSDAAFTVSRTSNSSSTFISMSGKLKISIVSVLDIIENRPEYIIKINLPDTPQKITEPRPAESTTGSVLPNSNEKVLLATPLPVVITGTDGTITTSNFLFSKLTGYSPSELTKLKLKNLLHPEDIPIFKSIKNDTNSEVKAAIALRFITRSGSTVIVNCNYASIQQHPDILTTVFILNDITAYKTTEAALQQAGANVTAVIENTDAPIFSIDFNHRITVMNSAFIKEIIKRTTKKPSVGDDVRSYFDKEQKQDWEVIFPKVMKAHKVVKDEVINYTDDSVDYFEVSCFPILNSTHLVIGVSVLYRKVTEQIRIEEELIKAKERAESATKAKSDFLATMSHEIRTPLNGVLGMTDLLNSTTLNEGQKEYVDAIKISGEALLAVINDVLDYSKIESGKMELENQPFDVADCVKETFDILRYKALEKGNLLSFKANDGIPEIVSGDKARLRQILVNLVGNAIKFTDKGTIQVTMSPLKKSGDEIEIQFAVKDSGIGMTQEQIDRLFQSFSQADASTYGKYGGSGLGLTISQRLAALMQGKIRVESEPGKGSTFFLTITCNTIGQDTLLAFGQQQDAEFSVNQLNHPNLYDKDIAANFPLRILIAEDNEVNQILAKKLFQKLGYEPDLVVNGQAAFESFEATDYDIIFMDVQMPVMNGFEATEKIRAHTFNKRQPVIVAMTAMALEGDREKCIQAGMNDYLSKPVQIDSIKSIIFTYGKKQVQTGTGSSEYKEADLIDNKVINRLIDMAEDDLTFLGKLIELFIKQSAESVEEIYLLSAQGNFTATYQAAHKLKGSSLNLGAIKLSEICKHIEKACDNKDQESLNQVVKELSEVHNSTISIYKKKAGIT